jgi:aryl-alcohol dehydrogenase-like predicted oxidoreductase
MRYRVLGKTKLKVSVLGFGGAALAGGGRDWSNDKPAVDPAENARAVRAALAGGINFFDVSPFYADTRAETELGAALAGVPRDQYFLSTKAGRYWENEFDFSTKRVLASVDDSLRRLKTDYLDIIHCHDIEFGDLDQVINETIPALAKLKKSGKVRFVGVTGYALKALWYVAGRMDLDTVMCYCHYTLNDRTLTDLIPYLQSKKIGIINAAPLGMGLLTGSDKPLPKWHPAPEELREACRAATELCRSKSYEISDLAVKFAADRSELSTTLVGMSTVKQVERNIAAIDKAPPPGLMNEVDKVLAGVKNKVWVSGRVENN